MSFLKAEWRKLAMANYVVEPKLLHPYVPFGTELDLWEGKCYISLVGFMFLNTKMLGLKIPFHVNFEEVNLRFYVRRKVGEEWKRGVVFIKEIVPKRALAIVANTLYKEHYVTMKMKHEWKISEESISVSYHWKFRDHWNSFMVKCSKMPEPIVEKSEIDFITDHFWGYAMKSEDSTNEYEVTHPRWLHYPVRSYDINIEFGKLYGDNFEFLNNESPASVLLAEGSEITVEPNKRINN